MDECGIWGGAMRQGFQKEDEVPRCFYDEGAGDGSRSAVDPGVPGMGM